MISTTTTMEAAAKAPSALDEFNNMCEIVRDRIRSVVLGLRSSLYLWGEGGTGKSYLVAESLKDAPRPVAKYNSRMTARGLFDALCAAPDAIHVIEDMEPLLDDGNAQGVVRAATDADGTTPRLVTWTTRDGSERCSFAGGVIIVSNCSLADRPILRAVGTRLDPIEWRPSAEQLAAVMRNIASRGYAHVEGALSREDCLEVAEHITTTARERGRRIDLRLLLHGFLDRLQWQNGDATVPWKESLRATIEQAAQLSGSIVTRAAQKRQEHQLLAEIVGETADRPAQIKAWRERVGKSEKSFYRRLKEAGGNKARPR